MEKCKFHLKNGETVVAGVDNIDVFNIDSVVSFVSEFKKTSKKLVFNINEICFIEFLDASTSGSSIIKSPTPGDIKRKEEEGREKKISSSDALISGIKFKAEEDK